MIIIVFLIFDFFNLSHFSQCFLFHLIQALPEHLTRNHRLDCYKVLSFDFYLIMFHYFFDFFDQLILGLCFSQYFLQRILFFYSKGSIDILSVLSHCLLHSNLGHFSLCFQGHYQESFFNLTKQLHFEQYCYCWYLDQIQHL